MAGDCIILWKSGILGLHLFYWTAGLFLLSVALWSFLDPARGAVLSLLATAGQDLLQLVCFAMSLYGCWMFILGLLGTLGTIQERRIYLFTSGVLLTSLILVGLLSTLVILLNLSAIKLSFRDVLRTRVVEEYGKEEFHAFVKAMDVTQYEFSCCGVSGWVDYIKNTQMSWRRKDISEFSSLSLAVPKTCCKLLNKEVYRAWERPQPENLSGCQSNLLHANTIYRWNQGCFESIESWMKTQYRSVVLGVVLFNIVQIITLYTTVQLYKKLGRSRKQPAVYL